MNFYICSVGVIKSDYIDENLERCISYKGHFMHKTTIHKGAFDDVQENDIIFLKYNNNLIAFGEVNSKSSSENIKLKDWNYAIYVKEWYFHDQTNKGKGVGRYGIQEATLKGDQFATIKQINENYALGKIVEIAGKDNPVFIKIKKIMDNTNNNKMRLNLLTANHNLILTGAPGTGKTYLAKQIAQQMIFGEVKEKMTEDEQKQLNEQCVFVQFHPSYDYTDFVEGLRPIQDKEGNVGFERKDGVFKEFCKKALRNPNPNEKYVFIIDEINRGEISKIFGELFFSIDPGYRGTDGKVRTQYANMQKEKANDFDNALGITDPENYGHFFVPENVYIIGTMNDIDRSVESMDFAFRRRFAFKEITAEESKHMLDSGDAWGKDKMPKPDFVQKIKDKMDAINKVIFDDEKKVGIEGLSSAYHIGASYFLKLANYRNESGEYVNKSFTDLWDNHLEGLLREYLRGMQNVEENLAKLKEAYKTTDDAGENQ